MGYFASSSLLYRNAYLQAASQFQSNNPSLALIQKRLFQFQQDGQECQIGIYIAGEQDIDLGIILRMGNENEPYHVFFSCLLLLQNFLRRATASSYFFTSSPNPTAYQANTNLLCTMPRIDTLVAEEPYLLRMQPMFRNEHSHGPVPLTVVGGAPIKSCSVYSVLI